MDVNVQLHHLRELVYLRESAMWRPLLQIFIELPLKSNHDVDSIKKTSNYTFHTGYNECDPKWKRTTFFWLKPTISIYRFESLIKM